MCCSSNYKHSVLKTVIRSTGVTREGQQVKNKDSLLSGEMDYPEIMSNNS